jgi:trk system potassium uptake protein TrkA
VLARASRDVHAKFLLRNGADRVIYPEKEMAVAPAVQYSSNHIFDYIALTPIIPSTRSPYPQCGRGKHRSDSRAHPIPHQHSGHQKKRQALPAPQADHEFDPVETLIILGQHEDVKKLID